MVSPSPQQNETSRSPYCWRTSILRKPRPSRWRAEVRKGTLRSMSRVWCAAHLLSLMVLLATCGCGGGMRNSGSSGGGNSQSGPTVTSFAVSPNIAAPGESVNFSWTTANATAFTTTPEIAQQNQPLTLSATAYSYDTSELSQTTTFQAVASTNSAQSPAVSTNLTIIPVTLSASATTVAAGQSVTLTYGGPNNGSTWALVVVGNNTPIPLPAPSSCDGNVCTGTYQTPPLGLTTTFQVTATGTAGGQANSSQVLVTVENPTTISLSASPATVPPGGAVTLSWTTTNAASVSIDQGVGQVAPPAPVNMGSYCCARPTQTTTYTATAISVYPGVLPTTATVTVTVSSGIPQVQHVVIVVLENLDYSDIVGSPNAPYINSLIPQGGLATNYYADVHPSIGNYFIMTTGIAYSTDDNFNGIVPIDNVVREFQAANISWKVYAQSLPSQGYLGGDVYPYLHRHNPISYLSDVQPPSRLNLNIVDSTQFQTDILAGHLPAYSFVVPDAEHDAHDCPGGGQNCTVGAKVAAADAWLSANISPLLANSAFQQSGLFILTTDESRTDNTNGGGRVATVLLGTHVKPGYQGGGLYEHKSLLGLSMTALGDANIPNGAGSAPQMTEFFH